MGRERNWRGKREDGVYIWSRKGDGRGGWKMGREGNWRGREGKREDAVWRDMEIRELEGERREEGRRRIEYGGGGVGRQEDGKRS
jgi:hypothetical protein